MKTGHLSSAQWEALLARIQSPSRELEAELAKSNANLIGALAGLEELEKLTQTYLQPHLQPQVAAQPTQATLAAAYSASSSQSGVQPGVQPSAPASSQATPVHYQTSHEEYAPALNQSALVEALLQYQRKKALRSPKSPGVAQNGAKGRGTESPAFARSDFAPMKIPAIETEPKASPLASTLGRAAAPGVRLPVLRLKSENSNHDEQD